MSRRYIASALFAEGPTDHRFLQALLPRSMEALAAEARIDLVEVGPVRQLAVPRDAPAGRPERVTAAVLADEAAFHILFLHADADGDAPRARSERIEPVAAAVNAALGANARVQVPVIPIQMTEAWALADLDALRSTLSTRRSAEELGLPAAPGGVEAARDPKALLGEAVRRARPRRRGRRPPSGASFLDVLGEEVSLEALRALTGYVTFEDDLRTGIAALGLMPLGNA